jgi:hypothetical protein
MQEEFKKQFQVILYEDEILIITPHNNKEAFKAKLSVKNTILIGWHDWIETPKNALNYYECCGILILFGITPPAFDELRYLLSPPLTTEKNIAL